MESPELPRHVAIIMDGNGRWAKLRSHSRLWGHVRGASRVKPIVRECDRLGIEALTLYAFSAENWSRPFHEVQALMKLLKKYLRHEVPEMKKENIRFRVIGDRRTWPRDVLEEVVRAETALAGNTGFQLTFAFGYGAHQELVSAFQKLAENFASDPASMQQLDSHQIEKALMTSGLPNLDLLIRTGGEQRLSNFLLWQAAYAELYFIPTPWPEFSIADLHQALRSYDARQRRFGLTSEQLDLWQTQAPQQQNG